MKGVFKTGMTGEELKAMGIKFSKSQYDKDLHFDVEVTGANIESLQNPEMLFNVVNANLKAAGTGFRIRAS